MIEPARLNRLLEGIRDQEPVNGLTHNYYRYPARFSPSFARAVIETFTQPGDLIYDPFMGGGTSLVEAAALGRQSVGTDISSLAVFIASAKTAAIPKNELNAIDEWFRRIVPFLSIWAPSPRRTGGLDVHYQRNINGRDTWRIRKLIQIALNLIKELKKDAHQQFARCIVLNTAQWALDCRTQIPSVNEFRKQLLHNGREMIAAAREFTAAISGWKHYQPPVCLHRSAIGIEDDPLFPRQPVSLVLTSPPYPGVHVLYHRWQIQGRKETPAPFWIASTMDGAGASFYTFGGRAEKDLRGYYESAMSAFKSIARVVNPKTLIVQMVAFTEPDWQLPKYLEAMNAAGLEEWKPLALEGAHDKRAWRDVPNRKWYANLQGRISASKEVVLFHRLQS